MAAPCRAAFRKAPRAIREREYRAAARSCEFLVAAASGQQRLLQASARSGGGVVWQTHIVPRATIGETKCARERIPPILKPTELLTMNSETSRKIIVAGGMAVVVGALFVVFTGALARGCPGRSDPSPTDPICCCPGSRRPRCGWVAGHRQPARRRTEDGNKHGSCAFRQSSHARCEIPDSPSKDSNIGVTTTGGVALTGVFASQMPLPS